MKTHIVTVINSRTRGLAPMMMGNLSDEDSNHHASSDEFVESEDGELNRLEVRNGKKVFTKPRHDSSKGNTKGGGKGRTDKECFCCGRFGHIRADCRAKTHINGRHPKSAPQGKGVGRCEEAEPETSQHVSLGTIDLGSFEVLSDHGDTVEDDVDVDESSEEATGIMPPLPLASWFKKTGTSKHTEVQGVWTTAGKSCLYRKLPKQTTSRMPSKLGKTLNNDIENALEISYPRTCDLLFFSLCDPQILRKS